MLLKSKIRLNIQKLLCWRVSICHSQENTCASIQVGSLWKLQPVMVSINITGLISFSQNMLGHLRHPKTPLAWTNGKCFFFRFICSLTWSSSAGKRRKQKSQNRIWRVARYFHFYFFLWKCREYMVREERRTRNVFWKKSSLFYSKLFVIMVGG